MAYLVEDDETTREAWLMYAIEFARRGLWPTQNIETHGPHPPECCIWGKAMVVQLPCEHEFDEHEFEIQFTTPQGRRSIWDVRGLRVQGC